MSKQRPPKRRSSFSSAESTIGIMTFNTWLIPVRANFPCCLDCDLPSRADRVSNHVTESVFKDNIDIVTLQEVWSGSQSVVASCINCLCCCRMFQRAKVIEALKTSTHLRYHTSAHGTRMCECASRFLDSGLMIMSKWPIVTEEFSRFAESTSEDSFASKGALCVVLDRGKDLIIVVTTHMDAGDDAIIKLKQLQHALGLYERVKKSTVEVERLGRRRDVVAAFFTGDFNIDGTEREHNSIGPDGESLYALARKEMQEAGFSDAWTEFAHQAGYGRPQSFRGDWSDLRNSIVACYGATNDESIPSFPTRLDYIWATHITGAVQVELPPPQQRMANSDTNELELIDVKVADATLWRGNLDLRNDIEKIQCPDAYDSSEKMDLLKEYRQQFVNRTSDHASLTAKVRLKRAETEK
ncbi:sphingomyelin phosphodiesterase 3, neutral membrane (neutral sphingomyelinase II) [Perkinsus olseni]|uniref:Sphingomyelin phosphodiesterase 3, neutral membrane (Neutral sphingomyelinase II) n=4 Tax=Perkinsus olseni TaxID=32597 RepID=A0A7J6NF70_PEROL|nr:sphingomyelin phosphodiesterase 3, neutral membrane (neutral sphingomyelinase II) [Perkinsus olseni]